MMKKNKALASLPKLRPDGQFTPTVAQSAIDQKPIYLEISQPIGGKIVFDETKPLFAFVAGSGITPFLAFIKKYTGKNQVYLDYSENNPHGFIYQDFFSSIKNKHKEFDYILRDTSASGRISREQIIARAKQYANAKFLICGPDEYIKFVLRGLTYAGIKRHNINFEFFNIKKTPKHTSPINKKKAYTIALSLCLIPLLLLLTNPTEKYRPHGMTNIGHEKLKCIDCHKEAEGTLRQQIQAKVGYWLGNRKTDIVFGKLPVSTKTCTECHANPDDAHPAQRFLEPKYDDTRVTLAVHECITCHREHSNRRVTIKDVNYCVLCHKEMVVKNDPAIPSHESLVNKNQWHTCMQCHDFHGNHKFKTPFKLEDAHQITKIHDYLNKAENPYGPIKIKAIQPE